MNKNVPRHRPSEASFVYGQMADLVRELEPERFKGPKTHTTAKALLFLIETERGVIFSAENADNIGLRFLKLARRIGVQDTTALIYGWIARYNNGTPKPGLGYPIPFFDIFDDPQDYLLRGRQAVDAMEPPIDWRIFGDPNSLYEGEDTNVATVPIASSKTKQDDALDTRSRNTHLVILAALCRKADIHYDSPDADKEIAELTKRIGCRVGDRTIKKILAAIPDALESRSKD